MRKGLPALTFLYDKSGRVTFALSPVIQAEVSCEHTRFRPRSRTLKPSPRLEQEFLEREDPVEWIGDAIGSFVGTLWFIIIHLAWFLFWFLANAGKIPGVPLFDPYPFVFLSMAVSVEGVLLTTFVSMRQNRMAKRADCGTSSICKSTCCPKKRSPRFYRHCAQWLITWAWSRRRRGPKCGG
jgi:hypothetical protein